MESIVNNIIDNFTNYDSGFNPLSSGKNKEKSKANMSIKTEEKVNFVFEEDDEEDQDINDIDNILSFE